MTSIVDLPIRGVFIDTTVSSSIIMLIATGHRQHFEAFGHLPCSTNSAYKSSKREQMNDYKPPGKLDAALLKFAQPILKATAAARTQVEQQ